MDFSFVLYIERCQKRVINKLRDEKILSAIKNRDEKVMAELIEKYSKLLWKIASAILINAGSVQDIEECIADTFIDFWMYPDKYNPEKSKLSSYLSIMARSKAIDRYRQIARRKEIPIEEIALTYQSEILKGIIEKEEKGKLVSLIEELEETDREIIIRRFYYGQKPKEIAVALDMQGKQVENRLYQTKLKLKKMMQ